MGHELVGRHSLKVLFISIYETKIEFCASTDKYFNKTDKNLSLVIFQRRSTAMGFLLAGASIGVMVLSQVMALGMDYFGDWQTVMRILSGSSFVIW